MKRIKGFVRWYDKLSDDGIISDLEGNEYYFNSWSFPSTKYKVTGICKKTGKKKTIKTRAFPGLFLSRKTMMSKQCEKLNYDTPVVFEQAEGIDQRWAVKIRLTPQIKKQVLEYRFMCLLDSVLEVEADPREWYRKIWLREDGYYENRLTKMVHEVLTWKQ